MLKKTTTVLASTALLLAVAACGSESGDGASAEASLPSGDITNIIPVAAGGGTDLTHRALAETASGILDRTINVVNVPGAGGSVGFAQAAGQKANGLSVNSYTSEIFTLPIFQDTAYEPDDFVPLVLISEDPAALVVANDSEFETIEDFIAAAEAGPGSLSVGNSGFGNIWHLSAAAFEQEAGLEFRHVPFDGAAPTLQAAMGGHIDAFVASPPEVAGQVEGGELRILAVMSDERSEAFPDVPTLKESGVDLSIGTWRGLGAPSDTPEDMLAILIDGFSEAIQSDEFAAFMDERGMNMRFMDNEEFTAFVEQQRPFFEDLASTVAESAE